CKPMLDTAIWLESLNSTMINKRSIPTQETLVNPQAALKSISQTTTSTNKILIALKLFSMMRHRHVTMSFVAMLPFPTMMIFLT
ncbi:hypothetical protein DFQ28_005189, partial [Apophysomyces sp. BC1034]